LAGVLRAASHHGSNEQISNKSRTGAEATKKRLFMSSTAKRPISRPVSVAVEMMLAGARPPTLGRILNEDETESLS
jgi:hypothetical protein